MCLLCTAVSFPALIAGICLFVESWGSFGHQRLHIWGFPLLLSVSEEGGTLLELPLLPLSSWLRSMLTVPEFALGSPQSDSALSRTFEGQRICLPSLLQCGEMVAADYVCPGADKIWPLRVCCVHNRA